MELTRSDLNRKYNISDYTWKARHDELLDYLREYMDIKEIKSDTNRYSYEITGEMPDSIPKIPRKSQRLEKIEDYSIYVRGHLPYDFQPYSKAYMARQAINDFGHSKYSHNNEGYIVKAFVGPAMNQYGEHTTKKIWVDYQTYEPLTQEQLVAWREILRQESIGEREAADAFYADAQGEDISDAKNRFKRARNRFEDEYGFTPIRVGEWRRQR